MYHWVIPSSLSKDAHNCKKFKNNKKIVYLLKIFESGPSGLNQFAFSTNTHHGTLGTLKVELILSYTEISKQNYFLLQFF